MFSPSSLLVATSSSVVESKEMDNEAQKRSGGCVNMFMFMFITANAADIQAIFAISHWTKRFQCLPSSPKRHASHMS